MGGGLCDKYYPLIVHWSKNLAVRVSLHIIKDLFFFSILLKNSLSSAEATFLSTFRISPGFLERYDKNTVRWGISVSIGDCPEKQENKAHPSFRIFTDGRK